MTTTKTTTKTRRTPDQIVADLEAKIASVKARAIAKEAKAKPEGQALITAIRALDKATRVATEASNEEVATALDAARATLAPALIELGLRLPEPRAPKRRRAKAGQAA